MLAIDVLSVTTTDTGHCVLVLYFLSIDRLTEMISQVKFQVEYFLPWGFNFTVNYFRGALGKT